MTATTVVPVGGRPGRAGPVRARLVLGGLAIWYGLLEIRRAYTLTGYLISWMLRVAGQVLFFGLLGRYVGGTSAARYLVIGTAVGLILLETLFVVFGTVLERNLGTLAMLSATPSAPADVFLSRGLQFAVTAVGSATVALVVLPVLLGVDLPLVRTLLVLPALACTALACAAYAATLSAIVLRLPSATWLVINLGYLLVTTFTGVAVPVSYWPAAVGAVSTVLPVRHGLAAIRAVYDGAGPGQVVGLLATELAVAVGWAVLARLAYRLSIAVMRRNGRLDLPS